MVDDSGIVGKSALWTSVDAISQTPLFAQCSVAQCTAYSCQIHGVPVLIIQLKIFAGAANARRKFFGAGARCRWSYRVRLSIIFRTHKKFFGRCNSSTRTAMAYCAVVQRASGPSSSLFSHAVYFLLSGAILARDEKYHFVAINSL